MCRRNLSVVYIHINQLCRSILNINSGVDPRSFYHVVKYILLPTLPRVSALERFSARGTDDQRAVRRRGRSIPHRAVMQYHSIAWRVVSR
jgi:hypothetical protein